MFWSLTITKLVIYHNASVLYRLEFIDDSRINIIIVLLLSDLRKDMPIYEYECKSCGAMKEVLHGMSEDKVVRCGKMDCDHQNKSIPMTKVISATPGYVKGTSTPTRCG